MPYQSRNYIGVDCADVLVATTKVMNKEKNTKNYNVVMLVDKFKTKQKFKIDDGVPNKKLKWGKEFKKGDFIAVKYRENGRYAHIGMLYADENKNGILDKEDSIINAGPNALHLVKLSKGAFDGTVVILKNKDIN
jgi:Holliday junction resolvase